MPDPVSHADELKTRARFYAIGCWINCVLSLVFVTAVAALMWIIIADSRREKTAPAPANVPDTATTRTEDEKAIRRVLDAQVMAWNKGDLDGFMAGYWRDDKLTFTSGDKVTRGWNATRARYQKKYFTPNAEGKFEDRGELSFGELEVERLSSDTACVRGRYFLKLAGKTDTGRFTLSFRLLPEGWRITSDHTSVDCPPEKK